MGWKIKFIRILPFFVGINLTKLKIIYVPYSIGKDSSQLEKDFKYFTQKCVSRISEIWVGSKIRKKTYPAATAVLWT
jgi:hypothetical protein